MKRPSIVLVLALLALSPVPALADAPAARKPARVRFDPAKVVSVAGTVLGEHRVDHGKGVKSVHLGPDTWVDRQKLTFEKGDEVTVTGSRFTYDGGVVIIAQSVTRGADTLVVRDAAGKPAWSGQVAKQ